MSDYTVIPANDWEEEECYSNIRCVMYTRLIGLNYSILAPTSITV